MKVLKAQQTSGNVKERDEMIYDSHYNRLALRGINVTEVSLFDTTLRDGEQAPGIALSTDDKIRIASALGDLGVDVIEAGFAASGASEKETIKKIVSMKLQSEVCSLARSVRGDVDAVIDSGANYVHTFLATSDIHLKYKLKMTREEVKARAVDVIEYARSHGLKVQFSCEDATRTELDFLKEMHIAAQDAGASVINVPDTVGVIYPSAMTYLISELKKVTKVPIAVHCHNDMGLAVANSLAAAAAGAGQIHVCVNGLGERTGNAALEEIALGLYANFGISTVDMSKIGSVSKTVSRITGYPIPYNKPVVGRNAFAHESGIHVHGVLNNAATYEAFRPELVGVDRQIVIGKHSGAHSVKDRLNALKVDFPDEKMPELLVKIKELATGGKEIDDAELMVIADHLLWKQGEKDSVVLEEFAVFTGKGVTATATVTVNIDGKRVTNSNIGIGPVDASINAIRCAVNDKITLEEYKLSAVTGGSDSLCEVTVVIKGAFDDSRMSAGRSVGVDIVATSVEATMEAINRDYNRGRKG